MWYNIRPCSFNDMKKDKTPLMFIQKICEAINETPNKIADKENTINTIMGQFHKLQLNE